MWCLDVLILWCWSGSGSKLNSSFRPIPPVRDSALISPHESGGRRLCVTLLLLFLRDLLAGGMVRWAQNAVWGSLLALLFSMAEGAVPITNNKRLFGHSIKNGKRVPTLRTHSKKCRSRPSC
jgi:hypothetical protein